VFCGGGSLAIYDTETRQAIENLEDKNYAKAATELWDLACNPLLFFESNNSLSLVF
jgi:hypothetical protein